MIRFQQSFLMSTYGNFPICLMSLEMSFWLKSRLLTCHAGARMEKSRDGSLLDYNHLLTVSSATTLVLTLASWALLPPSSRTLSTKSASKSSKSKSNSEPSLFLAFQIKYLSVMVLVYRMCFVCALFE